jgi:hypothetical protein
MIWKCQRNPTKANEVWQIHQVEAPDEATARGKMANLSQSLAWFDFSKTTVWSEEEDWCAP